MQTPSIVPSGAPLGAEVRGIDIAADPDESAVQFVRDALHRHKVVVLRDQKITPEQQIAFCSRFGKLERHVLPQYLVPGYPDLVRVSNILDEQGEPIGMIDAGRVWHSDGQFLPRPNMYSMLYALEVPRDAQGRPLGATRFASTAHAYAQLPQPKKERVQGLRGVNSLAAVYESLKRANLAGKRAPLSEDQKREVVHPIVRTHPATGEKCLYVSRAATLRIEDLPPEDGGALIDELSDWVTREDAVYTHEWREGDLLMWDNCASQHLAVGDYALPQRRLMHRTTVGGTAPF